MEKKYNVRYGSIIECEDKTLVRLNAIESCYFRGRRGESPAIVLQTTSGAIHVLQKVENEQEGSKILLSCLENFMGLK